MFVGGGVPGTGVVMGFDVTVNLSELELELEAFEGFG